MKRKEFIKKSLLSVTALSILPSYGSENEKAAELHKMMHSGVGFNHLPNKEIITMRTILHKAESRGLANHGWLKSHHSFSFANYHNPERMNFGVLRVLNDDRVEAGMGFGTHPHDNMEIISIPLSGDLEHKDSMGNTTVIKEGDIQVMSAGTGIRHSEYNKNTDQEVQFLQIWVIPNKREVAPRYDQISTADLKQENQFYQVLSPSAEDEGVWVHQNAWFHIGEFASGIEQSYSLKDTNNGVYLFVLEGDVKVDGQDLNKRDGFGMWDLKEFTLTATSASRVLVMEVPMRL